MWRMAWLLVCLGGAGFGPSLAQGGVQGVTPTPGTAMPGPAGGRIDCTCRANGQDYAMGARVCLNTAQGWRLATCGMVQNVSSWRVSEEACVTSEADEPGPQPFTISQR